MAEGNVKGLEKQPKRDEESDRDAASQTAPNQVSTLLMQGVLTTPRPLCVEGDGAHNWRTWRQMWDAYATVSRIYEQSDEYQLATFIMCLGEAGKILLHREILFPRCSNGTVRSLHCRD